MRSLVAVMKKQKNKKHLSHSCEKCTAICCHNLAMDITRPRTKHDKELLRWYLFYNTVNIYIKDHRWHLLMEARCIYLTKKSRCSIYPQRPQVCRDHSINECERTGEWYDVLIKTPEEFDAYFKKKQRKRKRSKK